MKLGRKPNREILEETAKAVSEFRDKHGYLPSVKELSDELGLTTTPTHQRLMKAARAGLLVYRNGHYIPPT